MHAEYDYEGKGLKVLAENIRVLYLKAKGLRISAVAQEQGTRFTKPA